MPSPPPVLELRFEGQAPRIIELTEPIVTIGRSVDNVLEIPDPNMSRRHCVIERRETGEVILTDCNSSNGTKLNDRPVISHELTSGDQIVCGSTIMRFASSREELERSPPPPPPVFDEEATFRTSAARGLAVPKSQVAVLAHERDDLKKLLEITQRLNQVHDLRRLLETIIDAAIELMAAERGFLILLHDGRMKVEIARNMGQTAIADESQQVSTQVCRQVIESGQAVLTTNAQADERFGRYKSVVGLKLRSILCVPFRIKDETFGTVYLDAADVGAFSERDVELLNAFSDQAALAIENARLLHAARRRERMEQELKIGSQIQKKLLPRRLPSVPGVELYGWMHAAKEVGGDYYDFVPTADEQLIVCIGDVSGKGVPAGLVMASARSALRSLVQREGSTREIVVTLNRLLCEDLEQEMFLSFVLMRLDPATGTIRYTGAGHENILIWRAERGEVEVRRTGGMVLGMTTQFEDELVEQELHLAPGDGLLLYTDGVTETVDSAGEQFQLERLVDATRRHAARPAKEALHGVLDEVLRFKGRASQRDDLTLVVVKRTEAGAFQAQETRVP